MNSLDLKFSALLQEPGVKGVILSDSRGLPIKSENIAAGKSGAASSLVNLAQSHLTRDTDEKPTICVETTESNILLKAGDKYMLTIYKERAN